MEEGDGLKILMGIDEAGRGPVIGPMVISGFCIESKKEDILKNLGVRDSKEISPSKRKKIKRELEKVGTIFLYKMTNEEINRKMQYMNLNTIEAFAIASLINKAYNRFKDYHLEIYIDLPSTNPESFFHTLSTFFNENVKKKINTQINLILEHKADSKYLIVGAASIIAKVERDNEINKIKKKYEEYGDIGSGYPSDPLTVFFLKKYYKTNKRFPPEVRDKWATLTNIKEEINKKVQKKLF